jgi:hypothetical protein
VRDNDQQADNIFSRLISYTPRKGETKRERTALEDYFTEALAWCLRSSKFRKAFFDLLRENLPMSKRLLLPAGDKDGIEIHTQLSFNPTDDEEDEVGEGASGKRRRFDLVIHSSPKSGISDFVIVIEDKVKWYFTENQIPAYRSELEKGHFKNYQLRLLVLLSPSGSSLKLAEHEIPLVPLRWSAVQQKLTEFSGVGHLRPYEQLNLSAVEFVCAQFANFLKEKGLSPMKIGQTNPERLNSWVEGFEVRETLVRILVGVRSDGNRHKLKKDPVFDESDDGSRWLGLYNHKREEFFYLGFKLRDKNGEPDFRMFIQTKSPDKNPRLAKELKALGASQDGSDLNFDQKITDSEFDGNTDKIRGWFAKKLADIADAREKFA